MSESVTGDSLLTENLPEVGKPQSPKRAAIIAAAAELFLHSGYGAVSMDAIAAKAEVSKRTVYSHFPGKDVLFAAVMTSHCDRMVGMDNLQLNPESEPAEVLRDLGTRLLTLVTSPEAVALFRTVVAEADRFPELGRTFFESGPLRWIETLGPYLKEQDRRGRLKVPDPEAAATLLQHMVKDPLHMRRILGVQQVVTEAEVRAHVKAMVGNFMRLFAPD